MARGTLFHSFALLSLAALPAHAALIYGVEGGANYGRVFRIDTNRLSAQLVFAPTPEFAWVGATDGIDASSFFATGDISREPLWRIDIDKHTATPIGSLGPPFLIDLAYNESNGVLYGSSGDALYRVDLNTGNRSLVGAFNATNRLGAMDYDAGIGRLIGVDAFAQTYYVDLASGNATLVGPTHVDGIDDLWYDAASGQMFGVANGPVRLFTLDSGTGGATVLGRLPGGFIAGLGAPVPEPSALVCLALGSLLLLRRSGIERRTAFPRTPQSSHRR